MDVSNRDARVFDTWALLAWYLDEPAADVVDAMLLQADAGALELSISLVSAGEVFYRIAREQRPAQAEHYWERLLGHGLPIELVPATSERVLAAARLKATYPLSHADAFAAALARERNAPLATGDPEMRRLAEQGVIAVDWLGR